MRRIEDHDRNHNPGSKGRGRLRRRSEDPRAWMARGQEEWAEARKMGIQPRFTAMVARDALRHDGQDAGREAEGPYGQCGWWTAERSSEDLAWQCALASYSPILVKRVKRVKRVPSPRK